MNTLILKPQGGAYNLAWWPVLVGFSAMYLPTYYDLANGIWNSEDQAHGPIILLVVLYLIWAKRNLLQAPMSEAEPSAGASSSRTLAGWAFLGSGVLLYALGRSQQILLFEIGSQIPVLLGTLLIILGMQAVRALWFPLFFLIFMVPLPGLLVDAATGPLKQHISMIAETVLYAFGYPIGRSGVTLAVGPYQLLVADACSGLHSMFSLSALGLLYMYLVGHRNWLRNGILVASILPIAFVANVVRVMILVLVTYHFGDEAGQGIIHESASILLFMVAILLLFSLDWVLSIFFERHGRRSPA